MKILHITDLHLNPLNRIPQSRTEDFHAQIADKLIYLKTVIEEEKPDIGIISGDIFHLKNSNLYAPHSLAYYKDIFGALDFKWLSIPGNHDLFKSSYEEVTKTAYYEFTKFNPYVEDLSLRHHFFELVASHQPPTILSDSSLINVDIFGFPFYPIDVTKKQLGIINEDFDKDSFNILILHTDAIPDDSVKSFWDTMSYNYLLDQLSMVDLVCLGHIHYSFPAFVRKNSAGKTQMISKPWSFSRVVKDYFNTTDIIELQHKPSYSVINISVKENVVLVSIEYKVIPYAPFEKAFIKESLVRQVEKSQKVISFVQQIKEQYGNQAFAVAIPEDYLAGKELPEAVRAMIQDYVAKFKS